MGYQSSITSEEDKALAIVKVASNKPNISYADQVQVREAFDNQSKFVKTALDFSDEKMDNVKVSELPKLMKKAQEEITVGKMKKLLEDSSSKGVVRGILNLIRLKTEI